MLLQRSRTRPLSMPNMSVGQIPAPVRGLQLKSGIASMKRDEALILDNWMPKGGYCQIRGGHTEHATGLGASIGSLMEWAGPSSRKLFAATSGAIYDVTTAGAVGAADVSSLSNGYWQSVNFTTSGGSFLVACNGADDVRNYDGSSWTTPSITGVTSSSLINVASYKSRLWFVEKDSTKAWYLGVSSISGAATSLELGDKFRRGGKLQLIGSLSRDAGNGAQDVICFVSSRGEVVIYQGSDPSDTTLWSLIGVYYAAAPVGDRAMIRIDGDIALLTERGVVSVKQLTLSGQSSSERSSITSAIDQGILDDFASYGANTGWEMLVHARTRQAIVNVPTSPSTATQYALNIQTGAWCTYGRYASPLNATCWGTLNESLFFGSAGGTVYQAENGYQDDGGAITAQLKTSFQAYAKGALFSTTLVRPLFTAGGRVIPAIRMNVDYQDDQPIPADEYPGTSGAAGGVWDVSLWDVDEWGGTDQLSADWLGISGIGTTASINMVVSTNGITAKLNAFDIRYETAKVLAL